MEAARLGLTGLAVTDHDGFYGTVRFSDGGPLAAVGTGAARTELDWLTALFGTDNVTVELPEDLRRRAGQACRFTAAFVTNGLVHLWEQLTPWYREWLSAPPSSAGRPQPVGQHRADGNATPSSRSGPTRSWRCRSSGPHAIAGPESAMPS